MRWSRAGRVAARLAMIATVSTIAAPVGADGGAPSASSDASMQQQIEALVEQNREMQTEIRALRDEVRSARDEAQAADDRAARAEDLTSRVLPEVAAAPDSSADGALFSKRVGGVNLQLLDISLDTLAAFGWSSADDRELQTLQAGEHDPRQRGFTLQQVELGMRGAVDPYFTADAFLIYFIDVEGESRFELEEAFATTQTLPFGLEEMGLQIEAGLMFTEYGRQNPVHPHAWDWQDQAIVNSRLFGGDGVRQTGVRLGWLLPLPWYSELYAGMQNATGETMVSFLANEEVFVERPIGGRPFASSGVDGLEDLTYLARWVNGGDFGDAWSAQWGVSALFGPNATGAGGRTTIAGTDLVMKWTPIDSERGWPFVTWETEFSYRWYEADDFRGCPALDAGEPCGGVDRIFLPGDTLRDWGLYTQLLWGFRRGWSAGVRYGYASGSGSDVAFDEDIGEFVPVPRSSDPFRDDRHRVSPLLIFQPSEFARLRLQYNYDRVQHLSSRNVHTGWLGLEFLIGAHAAHSY